MRRAGVSRSSRSMIAFRLLGPLALVVVALSPVNAQRARVPELARLDALVGSFEGEVRLERAGAPPIVGHMTFEAAWQLDSAWVTASYVQTMLGRSTSGMLFFSWDARAQRYLFYGFPNTPMEPNRMRGTVVDVAFVFESGATTGSYRETWHRLSADTLVTSLAVRGDSGWTTGPRTVLIRRRP